MWGKQPLSYMGVECVKIMSCVLHSFMNDYQACGEGHLAVQVGMLALQVQRGRPVWRGTDEGTRVDVCVCACVRACMRVCVRALREGAIGVTRASLAAQVGMCVMRRMQPRNIYTCAAVVPVLLRAWPTSCCDDDLLLRVLTSLLLLLLHPAAPCFSPGARMLAPCLARWCSA
jgi:hypothetical protein